MPLVKMINIHVNRHQRVQVSEDHRVSVLVSSHKVLTYCPSTLPKKWSEFSFLDLEIMLRGYFPNGLYQGGVYPYDDDVPYEVYEYLKKYPNGNPLTDPDQISFFEYFKVVMTGKDYIDQHGDMTETEHYVDDMTYHHK